MAEKRIRTFPIVSVEYDTIVMRTGQNGGSASAKNCPATRVMVPTPVKMAKSLESPSGGGGGDGMGGGKRGWL